MHLDLVDRRQLVLDRVFDGDDLLRGRVELRQRGVQRGRLARAGRPGDQQDAVRARQQGVEARQVVVLEAHVFEAEADAGAVEHPHHQALAVHRGHRRQAQIEFVALDPRLDAPVLRQPPLGDVEVRQQLDARTDRGAVLEPDRLAGMDHAVDPVAHMQPVFERFEVDVRRAQVGDAADDRVDQPDHRRLAGQVLQVLDEIARVLQVVELVARGGGVAVLDQLRQRLLDLAGQPGMRPDLEAGGQAQRLQHEGVARRCHRDIEMSRLPAQRVDVVGDQEVRQQAIDLRWDRGKVRGGRERDAQQLRSRHRDIRLGHQAQAHQHALDRSAHLGLCRLGVLEISGLEFPDVDEVGPHVGSGGLHGRQRG